jgi:hypothetical protein
LPAPARSTTHRATAPRQPRRARDRRWRGLAAAAASVVLVVAVVLLVVNNDGASPPASAPSSTAPVVTAVTSPTGSGQLPVPEPLARALQQLERVTRP